MREYRCAVLGSTGMMGQRFLQILEDHPYFDVQQLFSSENRDGKRYGDDVNWILDGSVPEEFRDHRLQAFDPDLLGKKDIEIVFSALPGGLARDMEMEAAERGLKVFSNSSTHRMDPSVPILIPEVNQDHIRLIKGQGTYPYGFIVTNPNCSTTGLAMAMKPMMRFHPEKLFVSTYQSISGAGYPGIPSYSMVDNIIPLIETEEEKMVRETGKILGRIVRKKIIPDPVLINPSCARVPVKDGHLISVHMEMKDDVKVEEIEDSIQKVKGLEDLPSAPKQPLILRKEPDRPQHSMDNMAGDPLPGMSVSIGRIRKQNKIISFFLMVNNTIRGGAGNAVLSAELAHKKGYLGGV